MGAQTPETLVGGSYNGMVSFFDLRRSNSMVHSPAEESVIENSHHDPVYDVFWISSKVMHSRVPFSPRGPAVAAVRRSR
jgi:hypothetical protein